MQLSLCLKCTSEILYVGISKFTNEFTYHAKQPIKSSIPLSGPIKVISKDKVHNTTVCQL